MRRTRVLAALIFMAAGVLAGCSGSDNDEAAGDSATISSSPSPKAAQSKVQLVWNHTGTFFDETQVWYVARVTNSSDSPASVALDARALDATGTIVGSGQDTLPNIPAREAFDYFGSLGSGGFDSDLTGTPAKIEVSQAKNAFGRAGAIDAPMLKTSELKLTQGDEDTYTDAPLSYDLTVKVTNSTEHEVTNGVTQQVVLYDDAGKVVGGDTGFSGNVPDSLPTGMSYREQWTGIPAMSKAARAVYTVWAG